MPEATPLLLASLVTILSLFVVILVVTTSRRSLTEANRASREATAERDRRIEALEEEKEFLRALDSVRFTERYFATRAAIDDRGRRLEAEMMARQRRIEEVEQRMKELRTQDEIEPEVNELRSNLARTLEQARRLEEIVAQVNEIGPIRIDDVRSELRERRHVAARLKGRLEYLSMTAEARESELERLRRDRVTLEQEEDKLRRELDVTRSLGPAVDALLGVSQDRRQEIAQIEGRLRGSVGGLVHARAGGDPLTDFLRAIRGEVLTPEGLRGLPGATDEDGPDRPDRGAHTSGDDGGGGPPAGFHSPAEPADASTGPGQPFAPPGDVGGAPESVDGVDTPSIVQGSGGRG